MNKLGDKNKKIFYYLVLILIFILMGNNNNIPKTFANRIFKPLTIGSTTFYYANLILIIATYFSLNKLNDIKENRLLNSFSNRIIVMIIFMFISNTIWMYMIQLYKGFSNDLNAIYLNRNSTSINLNADEEKLTISGRIDLKNCSNETQEFYIKIKLPYEEKNVNEEYITLKDKITLDPKEDKNINIEEIFIDRDNEYLAYTASSYEYILVNDEDEVLFKGSIDEIED